MDKRDIQFYLQGFLDADRPDTYKVTVEEWLGKPDEIMTHTNVGTNWHFGYLISLFELNEMLVPTLLLQDLARGIKERYLEHIRENCTHQKKFIAEHRVGEGLYRRINRTSVCKDCGTVLAIL